MESVSVREARPSDAHDLATLCTQLGYPSDAQEMPARLARLAADSNARAFVAESGGTVHGLLTVHLRFTLNHAAPIAQITLLVVNQLKRGRGIGRLLVQRAEAWVAEQGSQRINVTTKLTRTDAHAFYESVGYTHTGRRYGKDFLSAQG